MTKKLLKKRNKLIFTINIEKLYKKLLVKLLSNKIQNLERIQQTFKNNKVLNLEIRAILILILMLMRPKEIEQYLINNLCK